MLTTSNLLRQQLAASKRDCQQLQSREEQLLMQCSSFSENSLEQEVQSLRLVLEMRRAEVEQLRAANNALLLEMERCRAQGWKLMLKSMSRNGSTSRLAPDWSEQPIRGQVRKLTQLLNLT